MSFAAASLGMVFGVAIGLLAGYSRNWLDGVLMRAMDALLAFPYIVLVLVFVSLLGSALWLIVLLVAIAWTPQVARVTRGITLDIASRDFVVAAEVLGIPRTRILMSEILPNLLTPLMVEFGLRLTWSVGAIAGLSFLGFGIQPPKADWGLMINENRIGLAVQPWAALAPILLIAALTIGTNLTTEGVARSVAGIDRSTVER
jgi:peptide/nickel transport system permease protein